jgi:RNA polymerase II subunit A small phosphatase-like protein
MHYGSFDPRSSSDWITVPAPMSSKPSSLSRISHFFHPQPGDQYQPPPPIPGKKTLVLDLDQTLVHAATIPPHSDVEAFLCSSFYIFKRPGLDDFLKFVQSKFDVFVFTHGEAGYAKPVLDVLMPWLPDSHRLYRDMCDYKSGPKKKLSIFNRKPADLILVDDSSSALHNNPKNTLQISAWEGVPSDRALIDWLPPILQSCAEAADVRKVIKKAMFPEMRKSGKSIPIIL